MRKSSPMSDEHRAAISASMKGKRFTESHKDALRKSKLSSTRMRKPKSRAHRDALKSSWSRTRTKRVAALIDAWSDPTVKRKRVLRSVAGNSKSPNGPETKLLRFLEALSPGTWKYNHKSLCIDNKFPDFYHTELPLLIEVYGRYWHKDDDPADRIAFFELRGYRTLVLWDDELNEITLRGVIDEFVNRGILAIASSR